MESNQVTDQYKNVWGTIRISLYILGAFVLFLFSLDLMTSSLQHMGKSLAETILLATSNPFTGLFIGLLTTGMLQSSSTTTSMVVALFASGSITLQSAVPIIMGANIGTTITSTIVSLGFINKKKEFRRAVAAGTYHDFFNILTAIVLFPLEYYYGFLSTLSSNIAGHLFTPVLKPVENIVSHFWVGFTPIINFLLSHISSVFVLILFSLGLLFSSILIFRRLISNLLKVKSPESFSRFFFKNHLKSFSWGLLTTAAIRSSSITTSMVVPLVAKKIVTLNQAAPFIMGANIGTTITAFIAATLNSNTSGAISIAIAHFLFNLLGALLFFPITALRNIPIKLAGALGKLTLRYRLVGFVYILVMFFFIPFSLIYFNQGSIQTLDLRYRGTDATGTSRIYRMVCRINNRTQRGEWTTFSGEDNTADPSIIYPVSFQNNTLFVGTQMFQFSKAGFCWDGEDQEGRFRACVENILPSLDVSGTVFDSVFVYSIERNSVSDSTRHRYYVSAPYKIFLKHEVLVPGRHPSLVDELVRFELP